MEEKKREINITPRERQMIDYCAQGKNDKEIAKMMYLSYSSIRNIFGILLRITGTKTRPSLIAWAYESGVLNTGEQNAKQGQI